jgi:hypothetical protein
MTYADSYRLSSVASQQDGVHNLFDRHHASFELNDLCDIFDVSMYAKSGFVGMNCVQRHDIALLCRHMSVKVAPPLGG